MPGTANDRVSIGSVGNICRQALHHVKCETDTVSYMRPEAQVGVHDQSPSREGKEPAMDQQTNAREVTPNVTILVKELVLSKSVQRVIEPRIMENCNNKACEMCIFVSSVDLFPRT